MNWKSFLLGLGLLLFLFGAFALSGVFDQGDSGITGRAVDDGTGGGTGNGAGVGTTVTECSDGVDNDDDGVVDLDDPDCGALEDDTESGSGGGGSGEQAPTQARQEPPQAYCGDGTCDADEGCDTCQDDCGECEEPEVEVEAPACLSDADCEDGDPCNIDKCVFPGHANAYCTDEEITLMTSTNNDGCCPEGARVRTDMDCEPVCGNGWCEPGENERICLEDCEGTGESGDSGDKGGEGPGDNVPC